jgi:hypothetical protein
VNDSMPGAKTCPKCGESKPLDQFHVDSRRGDGRSTYCRQCRSEARKSGYQGSSERDRQRSRDYYEANREQRLEYQKRHRDDPEYRARRADAERKRYRSNPRRRASKSRAGRMHGGVAEWQRMWDEQGGCCYLCGQPLEGAPKGLVHVDHDHSCCSGSKSCPACRRGLVHMACNAIIGLAGDDADLLRVIATNLAAADPLAKARIAAKPAPPPAAS